MSFPSDQMPLELAIFRLEDVCVHIQDGMEAFLPTAGLQKTAEIEAVFRWLHKRRVKVALISDHSPENTEVLLQRLGWRVGKGEIITLVLSDQLINQDPIRTVLELLGLKDGATVLSVFDTPRLLQLAEDNHLKLNLGVTNGSCSYVTLAKAPHHALLDEPIQLPNFLLRFVYPVYAQPILRKEDRPPGFFFPLRAFFW